MKVRTSVTISSELLNAVDEFAKSYKNRSEFVETALRKYIEERKRRERNAHELDILNRLADERSEEIIENLKYQIDLRSVANFIELKNQRHAILNGIACML